VYSIFEINTLIKIITVEAITWTRKYLIAISIELGLILLIRSGRKLIKLISRPIHAINHEEEEIAKIVPVNSPVRKIWL
jgi:hypothetical protein